MTFMHAPVELAKSLALLALRGVGGLDEPFMLLAKLQTVGDGRAISIDEACTQMRLSKLALARSPV